MSARRSDFPGASLGECAARWVGFRSRSGAVEYRGGQVRFNGAAISLWDSYEISNFLSAGAKLRSGAFSEDSRGRWYLNVAVEVPVLVGPQLPRLSGLGIDLGLKDFAALSDGRTVAAERFYRDLEPALARAQRARKKKRTTSIHAKISNRGKDFLHKLSTELVRKHGLIRVGNVNAATLAKTHMAKSVLDAGWSTFRTMLQYKCDDAGVWFEEVSEAFSTQTCSSCFGKTGPKGVAGLGVRGWSCVGCGAVHDRDVNAARNILAAGHGRPAEGITPAPAG